MSEEVVLSRSPEDTWDLARRIAENLPLPAVLALHGQLGSGKTCFVQGLAAALGVSRMVTSPTFTVVNEYAGGSRPLYHVDLYRLEPGRGLDLLGLDDYFESGGVTAIEWAERAEGFLPASTIHILFEALPEADCRRITVTRRAPNRTASGRPG